MAAKRKDDYNRWRATTVSFRASAEEIRAIDEAVALSGITKQEYIISKLTNRDVVVVGNPRVFKALKTRMNEIYAELIRLKASGDVSDRLIDSINLVAKIYEGMMTEK